jgi:hypothetical protein
LNIRSLTRGDGAVIVAAVLLLIASFLPFFTVDGPCPTDDCDVSAWSRSTFPMLPTVHILALVVAGLFLATRVQPGNRRVAGLGLEQWAVALSVVVGWAGIWSLVANLVPDLGQAQDPNAHLKLGAGAYLTIILALVVAVAGVLNTTHPAMKAQLVTARSPQPNQYGAQAGYGYPGGPQPGQQSPYGVQPQPGYGYPGGPGAGQAGQQGHPGQAQPQPQPQPQPAARQSGGPATGGGAPDPDFQPFWFAVPATRPLFGEDGSPQPVAELAPGTWYLAIEQRGQALVAQTQDGRRGVLQDTSNIQRG